MQLMPVKSSQIAAVGYDPETKKMRIQFASHRDGTNGSTYEYDNVEPQDHADLIGAKSIGSHFKTVIKPQKERWPYTKLTTVGPTDA